MTIAIGTYIHLISAQGTDTGFLFQNFHHGEQRTYNGKNYMYAAFGFSGGTVDIQAGNIDASIVFAVNQLDLTVFQQAVAERWLIEIRTVWLDPDTFEEGSTYGEEVYAITGMEHDTSRLSVRLGSPLDAVRQNAPRRLLTQDLVGSLPSTGNINLR
jgi:hypothetical protein